MPRFEHPDGRYWSIQRESNQHCIRWGGPGAVERTVLHPGCDEAREIGRKLEQGFVAIQRDALPLDEHGRVAEGTQRRLRLETTVKALVLEQDRLVVTRQISCMICNTTQPIERFDHTSEAAAAATLERCLADARTLDYRAHRPPPFQIANHRYPALESLEADSVVYADWLLAQGDPRGEIAARLQRDPAIDPDELVRHRAPALFGSMAPNVAVTGWRHGFATALAISGIGHRSHLDDMTLHLIDLPIAVFVHSLVVVDPPAGWTPPAAVAARVGS